MFEFQMNAKEFIREVYLSASPSVDLATATDVIDCCQHKIKISDYERILNKYAQNDDEKLSANLWCLNQGPQLVEDRL